jgi:hypothetical protein
MLKNLAYPEQIVNEAIYTLLQHCDEKAGNLAPLYAEPCYMYISQAHRGIYEYKTLAFRRVFKPQARACGAIGCISDCRSEGMEFDPHSGQSKSDFFSLPILSGRIVLVVQSCLVPTPPFPGMVIPVCQINNGKS